jgi:hypothetical protein
MQTFPPPAGLSGFVLKGEIKKEQKLEFLAQKRHKFCVSNLRIPTFCIPARK